MYDFYWITNPKKLREFRLAFNALDRNDDGIITIKELTTVLSHIGQAVPERDLREMIQEFNQDASDDIHFDEFLMIVSSLMQYKENSEEVRDAFRAFDNGKGFVQVDELRQVLETLGDKMSGEEVDDMMKEVRVRNGLINISEIVEVICR